MRAWLTCPSLARPRLARSSPFVCAIQTEASARSGHLETAPADSLVPANPSTDPALARVAHHGLENLAPSHPRSLSPTRAVLLRLTAVE